MVGVEPGTTKETVRQPHRVVQVAVVTGGRFMEPEPLVKAIGAVQVPTVLARRLVVVVQMESAPTNHPQATGEPGVMDSLVVILGRLSRIVVGAAGVQPLVPTAVGRVAQAGVEPDHQILAAA